MFLILALALVVAWVFGFIVFHTAGFLIHLLLIFAVISIIFHFLRGRSSAV
ncbi:MAG TPA: lmo0937 family membrane protein [Acidobacteriaceae bacterium]|nr:lmo0937 family membrane protein [Acidobacteriaceae bacterium]